LASMGHHGPPWAISGDHWRRSSVGTRAYSYAPAVASGGQRWPEVANWYQKVAEGTRGVWLQLATTGHQWRPVATSGSAPRWALFGLGLGSFQGYYMYLSVETKTERVLGTGYAWQTTDMKTPKQVVL
jgi:hypothetical protein